MPTMYTCRSTPGWGDRDGPLLRYTEMFAVLSATRGDTFGLSGAALMSARRRRRFFLTAANSNAELTHQVAHRPHLLYLRSLGDRPDKRMRPMMRTTKSTSAALVLCASTTSLSDAYVPSSFLASSATTAEPSERLSSTTWPFSAAPR